MRILRELNAAGHTIILVTHDMQVAKMRLVLSRSVMEKLLVTVLMFRPSTEESNLILMQHLLYKISRKKAKVFLLGVLL
jgi:ABC-type polar amino acid transport system ATPase subunit